MTKGERTRANLIETAARLFQRQGYHATGMSQIVAASGAPKGSMYFHFPRGKEELAAASATHAGATFRAAVEQALSAADPTVTSFDVVLTEIAALLASTLTESDFHAGCPLTTMALDAAADSEPIRVACDQAYRSWLSTIETALIRWGVVPADQAPAMALTVLSAIEGALVLARVRRDPTVITQVLQQLSRVPSANPSGEH